MNVFWRTSLVVLGFATAASAQPSLSTEETAKIKEEVTAAVHHYYRLFTERNMKALPEEVFHVPSSTSAPKKRKWMRPVWRSARAPKPT